MYSGNNSNNLGRNNKGRGWVVGMWGETKRMIEKGVTGVDEGSFFWGGWGVAKMNSE